MKSLLSSSFLTLSLLLLAASGLPEQVNAHGEAGLTLSATSTTEGGAPNIVDVDYSDLAIEAGLMGRFDFNLFADPERTKPVNFTDMWIRIREDDGSRVGKLLFAGPVAKQEFGGNGFSFRFPQGGKYTLSIRYNDASKDQFGETVAEAEFPLDVLRSREEDTFKFTSYEYLVGIGTGLFLAIIGLLPLLMRRKKSAEA